MKCLILAAGYATRLYPLTENFPKPLLKIGEKAVLDWLIDDIGEAADEFVVISNHKFVKHFEKWAEGRGNIRVLDDGTTSNENRLGAVRDLQFAIESLGIDDDALVIAGDSVLDFSLSVFIAYSRKMETSCVMRYFEPDPDKLRKAGVVEADEDDLILWMVEKPAEPKSHWGVPAFYFYQKKDLPLVKKGIESGCGVDAPGSFVEWLSKEVPVHAMKMPGRCYGIGSPEGYEVVREEYKGIVR